MLPGNWNKSGRTNCIKLLAIKEHENIWKRSPCAEFQTMAPWEPLWWNFFRPQSLWRKELHPRGCHGATILCNFFWENAWTKSQLLSSSSQRFHGFTGYALCMKIRQRSKHVHIWNGISSWIGLDRTLNRKLEGHFPSTQLWSNHNMITCLQNIQPDHTVAIWKRNHLFFAVPTPMVQLCTNLGRQGHIFDKSVLRVFSRKWFVLICFVLI